MSFFHLGCSLCFQVCEQPFFSLVKSRLPGRWKELNQQPRGRHIQRRLGMNDPEATIAGNYHDQAVDLTIPRQSSAFAPIKC